MTISITPAADARRVRDEIAGGALETAIETVEQKIRDLEQSGTENGLMVGLPLSVVERVADAYRDAGWHANVSGATLGLRLIAPPLGIHPDRTQPDGSPIKDFWSFVHERMLIWDRKVNLKQPRPWTDDPVLRDRFFTNIFRDLDPGTVIATDIVDQNRPAWERLWNLMVYRRFNREETWNLIGYRSLAVLRPEDDLKGLRDHLRELYLKITEYRTESGLPIFTDAHQVYPMPSIGGPADVTSRFMRVMLDLSDPDRVPTSIYELAENLQKAQTRKEAYKLFMNARIPGVQAFMSWQMTMDCTYGSNPIVKADDDWAPITTGARVGAIMVKEWPKIGTVAYPHEGWDALPSTPPVQLEAFVRELEERQDEEFTARNLRFDTFNRKLDMSALEHALCEFSKYLATAVGLPTRNRSAQAPNRPGSRRKFDKQAEDVQAAMLAIEPGSVRDVVESLEQGATDTATLEDAIYEPEMEVPLPAEATPPAQRGTAEIRFKEAVRAIHRRGIVPTSRLIFEELDMRSVSLNSRQAEWRREEFARLGYVLEGGNYVLQYGKEETE